MMPLTQLSQTILEQMPHAVYVRDAGMNLIYMNPAAERLTGWTVEDLCSEHAQSMDLIQGEGELCQGVCSGSGVNGIGLSPVATEGTLKTRFGHRVQIRFSLSPLSWDPEPGWVLCVMEFVSDRAGELAADGAFSDRLAVQMQTLPEKGLNGAAPIGESLDGGSLKDALRQSEERFRLIASAANDSLWDWDLETDTLWWSEVETGAFGHGPALVPSIPSWAEYIHPDDRERVVNSFHDSLSGNRLVWVDTYRFRTGDGTYIHIRDRGQIIRNQDGQAVRMVGAMTDITQEKRSESALQFFRHIISQVDDPIYWLSPEEGFRFVYVNEAACRHYGYPEEELLRLSIPDWDPNYSLEACEAFWQDLLAQKSKVFETLHRRRNGELVPVEITANYVAYEGKEYIAGTIKNITERKRAELERAQRERLVTLMLNTGPGCIKRIAADGTLLHMNPAGFEFIEAEREDDGWGRSVFELVAPEYRPAYEAMHQAVLQGEQRTLQYEIISLKGNRRWLETHAVPFHNPIGNRMEHLAVTHDITHRKTMEDALRRSEERFRALYDDIPSMYFTVSRDGTVLSVNRFGAGQLGYRPDELTGQSVLQIFIEEDRNAVQRSLMAAFERPDRLSTWEFRKVKKSGEWIWVREVVKVLSSGFVAEAPDPVALIVCADITEHKAVLTALRESQEQFSLFMSHLPGLAYIKDDRQRMVFLNKTFEETFHLNPNEWLEKAMDAIVPERTAQALTRDDEWVLTHQETMKSLEDVEDEGGHHRYYLSYKFPICREGRPMLLGGIAIDMTEQIHAELQRDRLFHLSLDLLCVADVEGKLKRINPAFQRTLGYTPEELEGQTFLDLAHQADRDSTLEAMRRLAEGKDVIDFPNRIRCRDGSFRWLEWRVTSLVEEGLIYAVGRDVTGRYHTMEMLRRYDQIVSASRSLLAFIDREYRYQAVNQQYVELFGQPQPFFIGLTVRELLGEDLFQRLIKPKMDRSLSGEVINFKEWIELPNLGRRFMDAQMVPFRDMTGSVTGVVVDIRDVTMQHLLEEQRRQGQKLEAIGTLAAGIAHDFNNILMAMLGFAELALMKAEGQEKLCRNLNEIFNAGLRAKDLVNRILTFSRQTDFQLVPVDLRAVLQEGLELLRASLPATVHIQASLGHGRYFVLGDAGQLQQIILNLGANSAYAMRSGGGEFAVDLKTVHLDSTLLQAHPHLQAGTYAQLKIRDTGTGISPEILPRIFDPFFTTKGVGEGTGLGLAAVHGIILAHGGMVTVDSVLGSHTTFTVYLPQIPEPVVDRAIVTGIRKLPSIKGKVLFLDDEDALARYGREMLEALGLAADVFTDPDQALAAFRANPEAYALVITDQTMPKMTGEDVIRILLQIKPQLPIILCTGYHPVINDEKAKRMGVKAFLMKPLQREELLSALDMALEPEL